MYDIYKKSNHLGKSFVAITVSALTKADELLKLLKCSVVPKLAPQMSHLRSAPVTQNYSSPNDLNEIRLFNIPQWMEQNP